MDIPKSDVQFIKRTLLPWANLNAIYLRWSNSKKKWPDIWCKRTDTPIIIVTQEWARQNVHERRKRLVHEFLHLRGLEHGMIKNREFSTYPDKDEYSKFVYRRLING